MFNNYLKSYSGSVPADSSGARSSGLVWRTYLAALLMLLASSTGLFAQAVWTGSATTTTNTTNAVGNPLRSATASNNCTKTQFLIRANELSSAGVNTARNLNGIAWFMQDAFTNSYTNLTIRVAHTTLTAMTSTFATPTFSTVFTGAFTVQPNATNYIPFSSAFAYDGSSGLLFEVVYTGTTQSTGTIRTNTTVTSATVAANNNGTPLITIVTTGTTSNTRPTTILFFTPPAGSAPTPVNNDFQSYTGTNLNSNNNFREGAGFFNTLTTVATTNISRWGGIVPASTSTPIYDGSWSSLSNFPTTGNTVAVATASSFSRSNSMLISPRITANAFSTFSFKYATIQSFTTTTQAMGVGDSIKVLVSTDDVNWQLLNGYTGLNTGTLTTLSNSLSAYAGQSIRVAIQQVNRYDEGTSWRIVIDDVSLTAPVAKDLGATSVVSPANPYCVTGSGNVVVRVTNAGTDPVDLSVDNLSLSLTIIKPDASSETINSIASSGTIAAGATADITFSSPYNFSAAGTYSFTNLTVALPGDLNTSNDILVAAGSVTALGVTALPLNETFATAVVPSTLAVTTFTATAAAGRTTSGLRFNVFSTTLAGTITSVPVGPILATSVVQFDWMVTPFTAGDLASMPSTADTIYLEYSTTCGASYVVGSKTTVGTSANLAWNTLSLDPSVVSSLAGQNIRLRVRFQGTTGKDYYINVDNIYAGPPQPLCNTLTLPGASATNQAARPTFTWSAPVGGPAPTGYYLYLGTDGGGTTLPTDVYNARDLGNVTTFTIPGGDPALNFNTTYFWTVVPYNASGTPSTLCVSNIRSFGTSDGKPQCITGSYTPANSSTNQSLTPTLTWVAPASGETATGYRITFGSAPGWNNVLDSFDVGNVLTYTIPTPLTVNTVYRWRVVPFNAQGNPVSICNWVGTFTTVTTGIPNNPTLSTPTASATGVSRTNPVFTWTAPSSGNSPTAYKFYFGTDGSGSTLPTNLVNGTNIGNVLTYTYTGTLQPGTVYRWAVISTNSFGDATATPTVRSFTSGFDPLVMNITRTTGITYNSIVGSGGDNPVPFNASASIDDANSQELNLTSLGFTGFTYSGAAVTRLTVNTNGWLGLGTASLAPSTLSFTNGFTTSATGIIAPLWDDLQLKGVSGFTDAINSLHTAAIRYKITGTAGSQVLTVEWKDVRRFQNDQASLNFQVKLYEADDRVEIVYGNMAMYNGNYSAESSAQYSYTMGLGAFSISSTPRSGEVLSQRFFNARNFRNVTENNLSVGPTCNSMYAFVPSGTADTGTEAEPVVANDACGTATALNVGFGASSTSFCQTYRTLAGAQTINDCNGTTATDDAAWFTVNVTSTDNYVVDVKGSPSFKPGVQVFSGSCGSLTQVTGACASSTTANIQTLSLSSLPAGTYFVRVYNTATGNGDVSTTYRTSFIINFYQNVPAPGNDNCSGATTLTVNASNITGTVAEATASVARPACTGVGANPADDDVWYKFTATSTSHRLYLSPVAGLSLAAEVWDTASCVTATSSTTKRIVCRAAGSLGAVDSVTFNTTIGNNYFIRIYNPITGAPFTVSYSFGIRLTTTPVNCVTRLAPTNNGQLAGLDAGSILRWRQATGGTPPYSYEVRFGTNRNSLPLVATISDTTYSLPALTNNQRYYWSIRPTTTGGDILPATCATDSFNAVAVTCPTYLAPFSAETGVATSGTTLEWRRSVPSAGTSYKVYLGTTTTPNLVATITDTFYNTGTLLAGYTYYWYVIPTRTGTGDQTSCSTTVRTFETAPGPLAYTISRLTNQPYNSIDTDPSAASFAWTGNSSLDDANSDALNLTNLGFTQFNYNGGPVSQIRVSTNGFMTFATSSTSSTPSLTNNLASSSNTMVVAPFWDDLYLSPTRGQAGSVKYVITGTPGSQVMTIEWIGIERFTVQGPSLNWQVKLYEADDKIEVRYGSMVMFTGGSTTTFTSSTGISSRFMDVTPTVGQTLALQQPNVLNFSNVDNGLLYRAPDCFSAYVFTPGAASYGSQTVSAPTNTAPGTAKSITVGTGIASVNYCGVGNSVERVRTSTQTELACGSASAPDDGAWFTFTPALNATTTVSVAAGPIFTPGLQVYSGTSSSLTAVACTTTTQGQTAEVSFSATAGTQYFARVYHNATGVATVSGQDGFFTINAFAATPKPANDSCSGAELITVSSATINGSTAGATGPHGVATSATSRFADDDVWYRFQATSTSTQWSVTGGNSFIPVIEIFDGVSCPVDQSTVITSSVAAGGGGNVSGTLSTTVGEFYYVRIYHRNLGSPADPAATFSFFIRNQPPNCVSAFGTYPANGATQVDTVGDGVGITWTSVTAPGTVSYNVYLGTSANSLSLVGNTSSTNFTFTGLDNATTYFYSIRTLSSTNGEAVNCVVRSFTTYILPGVPVCPTVSSPANGAAAVSTLPTINWATTNDTVTVRYTLIVSTNADLSSPFLTVNNIPSTNSGSGKAGTYTFASSLANNDTFYYRVIGYNLLDVPSSGTCAIRSFATVVANDNCSNATMLSTVSTCPAVPTVYTTNNSTLSAAACAGGVGSSDDDVWFSFVADATTHVIAVNGITLQNPVIQTYSSCATSIACYNDASGSNETAQLTGLTIGDTYRFRVYSATANAATRGTFTVCVLGTTTVAGNQTLSGTYGSIVVPSGATLTVGSGGLNVANLNISSGGTLNTQGNFASGSRFTVASGATIITAHVGGLSQTVGTGAIRFSTYSISTGVNVTYNGTTGQVTGNALPSMVNNLTLNTTGTITLTSASGVSGTLTVSDNTNFATGSTSFTFASNSSGTGRLAALGTGTVSGVNFTVQRWLPRTNGGAQIVNTGTAYQVGSGLSGATPLSNFSANSNPLTFASSPTSGATSIWLYDEFTGWSRATSGSTSLASGRAAQVFFRQTFFNAGAVTGQTGSINTGTFTWTLGQASTGWNLVSNPFPSSINFSAISRTNVANSFYVWNFNQRAYYGVVEGTPINPTFVTDVIPSSTGFFVQALTGGGSMSIAEAGKASSSPAPARSAKKDLFRMKVTTPDNYQDWLLVMFDKNGTAGYNSENDAKKLDNEFVNISTSPVSGLRLSGNTMPEVTATSTLPVDFSTTRTGSHTFYFQDLTEMTPGVDVFLVDNYTGSVQMVTEGYSYSFDVTADPASQGANRFEYIFAKSSTNGVTDVKKGLVSVYPNPNDGKEFNISVAGFGDEQLTITITDLLGKVVFAGSVNAVDGKVSTSQLNLNLSGGVYTVNAGNNTKTVSTKLVVKQ